MQIRYTHKLSMHKAEIEKFARRFERLKLKQISEIWNSNAPHDRFSVY